MVPFIANIPPADNVLLLINTKLQLKQLKTNYMICLYFCKNKIVTKIMINNGWNLYTYTFLR
jgi:hypothetical protein